MNKEELFEKYNINESHNQWDESIDNWMSVEIYRIMHNGRLPNQNDTSIGFVCDFLDKRYSDWWNENITIRKDWGSLYLTAKRIIYNHYQEILKDKNE